MVIRWLQPRTTVDCCNAHTETGQVVSCRTMKTFVSQQDIQLTVAKAKSMSVRTAEIITTMSLATIFNRLYVFVWQICRAMTSLRSMGHFRAHSTKDPTSTAKMDDGALNAASFDDPRDYFRKNFFKLVDCAAAAINSRLDTPGLDLACAVERLLLEGYGRKVNDALLKQVKTTWTLEDWNVSCFFSVTCEKLRSLRSSDSVIWLTCSLQLTLQQEGKACRVMCINGNCCPNNCIVSPPM